jgi:RNA polymerase sigma-70 factor, ECF subfamily
MNETQLAQRIQAGDRELAERFVRDHYPAVYRLMVRLTAHREEAEDLTQQTFVVARRNIGGFQGASSLRTWIHRIAVNEYKQWRRKRIWTGRIFRDEPKRDRALQAFEAGHVLSEALAKISDKQRIAFVLHEVEQLSMAEVAQILGIPVGTAKARVSYARHQLRTLLEDRREVTQDEPTKTAS